MDFSIPEQKDDNNLKEITLKTDRSYNNIKNSEEFSNIFGSKDEAKDGSKTLKDMNAFEKHSPVRSQTPKYMIFSGNSKNYINLVQNKEEMTTSSAIHTKKLSSSTANLIKKVASIKQRLLEGNTNVLQDSNDKIRKDFIMVSDRTRSTTPTQSRSPFRKKLSSTPIKGSRYNRMKIKTLGTVEDEHSYTLLSKDYDSQNLQGKGSKSQLKTLQKSREFIDFHVELGCNYIEKKNITKEVGNQVQLLENRVKRLMQDEENLKKKLDQTEEETAKIIEFKRKQCKDYKEIMSNKERINEELKKKKILTTDQKIKSQVRIQQKQEEKIIVKIERAKMIKEEIKEGLEKRENDLKQIQMQSSQKVKKGFENFMKIKFEKIGIENNLKNLSEKFYGEKCKLEEKKANALQDRIDALSKLEENLVDRINRTTQIAKSASDKKAKVIKSKFNKDELLEFNVSNDEQN